MVRLNSGDDFACFIEFLSQIRSYFSMRTFNLAINSLADIMEECCRAYIHNLLFAKTKFRRKIHREYGNVDGVKKGP